MNHIEIGFANTRERLDFIETIPVYFAQARRQGDIKIGFSTQVFNRLVHLGYERFTTMDLLGWLPGGVRVEREMHARFAPYRLGGEWFEPAHELLEFIRSKTRHDEPEHVASEERINDTYYDSLLSRHRRYTQLIAEQAS